jgi:hypothetical protein
VNAPSVASHFFGLGCGVFGSHRQTVRLNRPGFPGGGSIAEPAPGLLFVAGSGPRSQAKADCELLVVYSVIRKVREVARHDGSTVALVLAPDC